MVLVIGLVVVFFGLVLLIGLIKIMTMLTQEHKKKAAAAAPAQESSIPNRAEFLAAVSAAIAEASGTDASAIRILSVKKL